MNTQATSEATRSVASEPSEAPVRVQMVVSSRRTIELGPMAKPLTEQLAGLKRPLSEKTLSLLDRMADALSLLYVHGIISESEHAHGGKRLIKRIQKETDKAANEKGQPQPPEAGVADTKTV